MMMIDLYSTLIIDDDIDLHYTFVINDDYRPI